MRFTIVRLQVQRAPVKVGGRPRRYDPASVVTVPAVEVSEDGCVGLGEGPEERVLDVHHRGHPQTRDPNGQGGVTVMGTGDYLHLRAAYGPHLDDGAAGETILVDAPQGLAGRMPGDTFVVHTSTGPLLFHRVSVADPCVEFTRFCLGEEPSMTVSDAVRQALVDLDDGARGYRAVAAGRGVLRVGDQLEPG